MTLNLSPILKVWAADSSNVSSLTQGQIGAGIVLNSSVVSDDPNAALQIAYEAAQYLQQTAGLYSALIPYAYPAQATIIQYVNSEYFVRRFIRLTSNPASTTNNPPITGASIVTTNGIDVYSGGTDNTDWVEITSKLINVPSAVIGSLSLTSMLTNWTNAGRTIADLGTVTTAILQGGSINGMAIGVSSASTGNFTDLTGMRIRTTGSSSGGSGSRLVSLFTLSAGQTYMVSIQGNDSTSYMGLFIVFCQEDGSGINWTEISNMNGNYAVQSSGNTVQMQLSGGGDGSVYWSAICLN